jgi:hypothetical protein
MAASAFVRFEFSDLSRIIVHTGMEFCCASINIADQSTPSEKAARHVMLVLSAKGRPDIFSR